ncbi:hypothetical protein J7L85_01825, partial [candidate division WOR-3 bacterium]|nr:hypothetical protein [candidate division WOR-3 bacterium]
IKLVFVECNREQLIYFAEHLISDSGVKVIPLLLGDIRLRSSRAMDELKNADCVVTSFYHMEELQNLIPEGSVPIVGIHLQPEMSTIVKIARIPAEVTIGLVASSRQFIEEMFLTLNKMNIDPERVKTFFVRKDREQLKRFIGEVDAVIVSPSRKEEVVSVAPDKKIVEFLFAPDKTSINTIHLALLELRRSADKTGLNLINSPQQEQ